MIRRLVYIILIIPATIMTALLMIPAFFFLVVQAGVLFIKDGRDFDEVEWAYLFFPIILLNKVLETKRA